MCLFKQAKYSDVPSAHSFFECPISNNFPMHLSFSFSVEVAVCGGFHREAEAI